MKKIINVLLMLMLVVASLLSPVPHILSAEENETEGEIGPVAIGDEGQPVSEDEESPVIETVEDSSSADEELPVGGASDSNDGNSAVQEDSGIASSAGNAEAQEERTVVASGVCGDSAAYELDSLGVLTVSGTGNMYDYDFSESPFQALDGRIRQVVIEEGIESIGSYAFYNCTSLESITIPGTVTTIGSNAFPECSSLERVSYQGTADGWVSISFVDSGGNPLINSRARLFIDGQEPVSVTLSESITSIPAYAFHNCTSLSSITIPGSVTSIRYGAFSGCSSLSSITIPDSVKFIGESAFSGCSSLESITIPDSVKFIDEDAFNNCTSLSSITIPDSVTSIESWTFYGCSGLSSITIPGSVTSIGNFAFSRCSSLESVYYQGTADGWVSISFGDAYSNPLCNSEARLFIDNQEPVSVTLSEGIESIGSYAFYNCTSLSSIIIPGSVTSIRYGAFSGCSSLERAFVPSSAGLGSACFHECPDSLVIYTDAESDNDRWTSGWNDGHKVVYGSSQEEFARIIAGLDVAFDGNGADGGSMDDVHFPYLDESYALPGNGFSRRGYRFGSWNTEPDGSGTAYSDCSFILGTEAGSHVVLHAMWEPVSYSITYHPDGGENSSLNPSSYTVESEEFALLPASRQYYAFEGWYLDSGLTRRIESLPGDFAEDIDLFAKWSVSDREGLYWSTLDRTQADITIPDYVTSIPEMAFYGRSSLKSITIPDSVTSIGTYSFYNCTSLESITMPGSVTSIGSDAFYNCNALEKVYYEGTADGWASICFDGYASNPLCKHNAKLFINGDEARDIVLSDGITSISDYAFQCCTSLESITIPGSVTTIGSYAFSGCSSLEKVFYEGTADGWVSISFVGLDGNPLINDSARLFINGEEPRDIVLSDGITSIPDYAFRNCTSLKSITIPDSVTSIGFDAFGYRSSLEKVYYEGTADGWASISFDWSSNPLCNDSARLFINGEEPRDIVLSDGITSISDYAFQNCTSLKSITIPDSVTSIGSDAFYGCSSLEKVFYNGSLDGWLSLFSQGGYSAFSDCSYSLYIDGNLIEDLVIPGAIEEIGSGTFGGCSSIRSVTIPGSVTSIGFYAFWNCTSLEKVYYEGTADGWASISFGWYCNPLCNDNAKLFINGDEARDIVLSDGITSISDYAFQNCTSLKSITIPESVTSIGTGAFSDCTSLEKVIYGGTLEEWIRLPKDDPFGAAHYMKAADPELIIGGNAVVDLGIPLGITSIPAYAFSGIGSIRSITIPDSVTSIGTGAFYGCTSLEKVFYNGSLDGWLSLFSQGGYSAFSGCSYSLYIDGNLIEDLVIPGAIEEIGSGPFGGCSSIRSVTIPGSVTSIGTGAFYGCSSLERAFVPSSVKSLSSDVFGGSSDGLVIYTDAESDLPVWESGWNGNGKVVYNRTYEQFMDRSFMFWDTLDQSLEAVIVPGYVSTIPSYAFSGMDSLKTVIITGGGTVLEPAAFAGCSSLSRVFITKSIAEIGGTSHLESPFLGCPSSVAVYTDAPRKPAGWSSYYNCREKGLRIPTYYGKSLDAFLFKCGGSAGLSGDVFLPEGTSAIPANAFTGNDAITSLHIPSTVTSIGSPFVDPGVEVHAVHGSKAAELAFQLVPWQLRYEGAETIMLVSDGSPFGVLAFDGDDLSNELPVPTLAGHYFTGWKDGDGNPYDFTSSHGSYSIAYASYEPGTYIATLDAGEGSCPVPSASLAYGSPYGSLPEAHLDGFAFRGWMLDGIRVGAEDIFLEDRDIILEALYERVLLDDEDIPADGTIPEGLWTRGIRDEVMATGKAITQNFDVFFGATPLRAGTDYTVSYRNNTRPGTATITIRGKGSYSGSSLAGSFAIIPAPSEADALALSRYAIVTVDEPSLEYTGSPLEPSVSVTLKDGTPLAKGQDYVVTYSGNVSKGRGTILVTGINGYRGTVSKPFTVTARPLSCEMFDVPSSCSFMQGGARPEVISSLREGVDYTLSYRNNARLGTATLTIRGKGSYSGTLSYDYEVVQSDISSLLFIADDIISPRKAGTMPKLSVYDSNGKLLKAGRDYVIDGYYDADTGRDLPEGILPMGTRVLVLISGIGTYTGTAEAVAEVKALSIAKASCKVASKQYTGSPVRLYAHDISLTMSVGRTKVSPDYRIVALFSNTAKGTATAILRGTGEYGGIKTVKFKITAKALN